MIIRKATLNDIDLLIRLRIDYLTEDGRTLSQEDEIAIKKQLKYYFNKHIPSNTFIGVFAEIDGDVVSTAYFAIYEIPASAPLAGITGTFFNVLTYPEHRRKGIATKVINTIIDEAKVIGVSHINLSATSDGKHLYEKMGFKESSYTAMGLRLI
jgi:GNAT superfamily N-acetyltransferase